LERGVHFVEKEKVEDQKKELSERSSNITMKLKHRYTNLRYLGLVYLWLKYIIIIPIYSFTDKQTTLPALHATALLESLTDCSIRVSRSLRTKDGGWGHVPPTPLP